jgi:hypothetical protein
MNNQCGDTFGLKFISSETDSAAGAAAGPGISAGSCRSVLFIVSAIFAAADAEGFVNALSAAMLWAHVH